ncbi:MAG: endonuclease [Firmicutes bacterium]|nr:endonuclease [Bacillota bacterium]
MPERASYAAPAPAPASPGRPAHPARPALGGPPPHAVYRTLLAAFGPQRWWPAATVWEIVAGAILAQGTAWRQVEAALALMKERGLMEPERILEADDDALHAALRPAGYFRRKAERLRLAAAEVERFGSLAGWLDAARRLADDALRRRFLELPGVGPETADDLLLYAAGRAAFVADTYARRIGARLGWFPPDVRYEDARAAMMAAWRASTTEWAELHALLVELGKRHCRARRPDCAVCPLRAGCAHATGRAPAFPAVRRPRGA